MKAIILEAFGKESPLTYSEIPTPTPQQGEVQIKVSYAGVNPVDWKIREGALKDALPHQFPIILGWDAAGVVSAVGQGVTQFKVGDAIFTYCRSHTVQWGAYAEYLCVAESSVANKPKNLSFAEAAVIPLSALTAWQALFDFAHLKKGETILIHAGAGGVGSFAIQFAKIAGAKVYTTASKKNHAYVKSLGADVAIDYTAEDFVEKMKELEPHGIDVVLDCVGRPVIKKSFEVLKPNGRFPSIVDWNIQKQFGQQQQIKAGFVFVQPNGKQLQEIANLITAGQLKAPHLEIMDLQEIEKALEKSRGGHTQGKMALKVSS